MGGPFPLPLAGLPSPHAGDTPRGGGTSPFSQGSVSSSSSHVISPGTASTHTLSPGGSSTYMISPGSGSEEGSFAAGVSPGPAAQQQQQQQQHPKHQEPSFLQQYCCDSASTSGPYEPLDECHLARPRLRFPRSSSATEAVTVTVTDRSSDAARAPPLPVGPTGQQSHFRSSSSEDLGLATGGQDGTSTPQSFPRPPAPRTLRKAHPRSHSLGSGEAEEAFSSPPPQPPPHAGPTAHRFPRSSSAAAAWEGEGGPHSLGAIPLQECSLRSSCTATGRGAGGWASAAAQEEEAEHEFSLARQRAARLNPALGGAGWRDCHGAGSAPTGGAWRGGEQGAGQTAVQPAVGQRTAEAAQGQAPEESPWGFSASRQLHLSESLDATRHTHARRDSEAQAETALRSGQAPMQRRGSFDFPHHSARNAVASVACDRRFSRHESLPWACEGGLQGPPGLDSPHLTGIRPALPPLPSSGTPRRQSQVSHSQEFLPTDSSAAAGGALGPAAMRPCLSPLGAGQSRAGAGAEGAAQGPSQPRPIRVLRHNSLDLADRAHSPGSQGGSPQGAPLPPLGMSPSGLSSRHRGPSLDSLRLGHQGHTFTQGHTSALGLGSEQQGRSSRSPAPRAPARGEFQGLLQRHRSEQQASSRPGSPVLVLDCSSPGRRQLVKSTSCSLDSMHPGQQQPLQQSPHAPWGALGLEHSPQGHLQAAGAGPGAHRDAPRLRGLQGLHGLARHDSFSIESGHISPIEEHCPLALPLCQLAPQVASRLRRQQQQPPQGTELVSHNSLPSHAAAGDQDQACSPLYIQRAHRAALAGDRGLYQSTPGGLYQGNPEGGPGGSATLLPTPSGWGSPEPGEPGRATQKGAAAEAQDLAQAWLQAEAQGAGGGRLGRSDSLDSGAGGAGAQEGAGAAPAPGGHRMRPPKLLLEQVQGFGSSSSTSSMDSLSLSPVTPLTTSGCRRGPSRLSQVSDTLELSPSGPLLSSSNCRPRGAPPRQLSLDVGAKFSHEDAIASASGSMQKLTPVAKLKQSSAGHGRQLSLDGTGCGREGPMTPLSLKPKPGPLGHQLGHARHLSFEESASPRAKSAVGLKDLQKHFKDRDMDSPRGQGQPQPQGAALQGRDLPSGTPRGSVSASRLPAGSPLAGQAGKPHPESLLGLPYREVRERYAMKRVLGEGQFGVTKLAECRATGREFACKTILKASLQCEDDRQDLQRELQIFGLLQAVENVPHLEDTFEDAEGVHFVMELCKGGELYDRLRERKRFPEAKARRVMRTVLQVLQQCHARGIVHRDIKLENILLCSKASDTDVKVVDFGIAAFLQPGDKPLSEVIGSPMYMAPEVIGRSYAHAADLWSSGVVLFMLLCGTSPFKASSDAGFLQATCKDKLKFPKSAALSESAKDLIRRLLTRVPEKRLTAEEALEHPWMSQSHPVPRV